MAEEEFDIITSAEFILLIEQFPNRIRAVNNVVGIFDGDRGMSENGIKFG